MCAGLALACGAVSRLAETALIIVLASGASRVDRRRIRQVERLPIRLPAPGLPLTTLLGTRMAAVVFQGTGVPFATIALLAVLLPHPLTRATATPPSWRCTRGP